MASHGHHRSSTHDNPGELSFRVTKPTQHTVDTLISFSRFNKRGLKFRPHFRLNYYVMMWANQNVFLPWLKKKPAKFLLSAWLSVVIQHTAIIRQIRFQLTSSLPLSVPLENRHRLWVIVTSKRSDSRSKCRMTSLGGYVRWTEGSKSAEDHKRLNSSIRPLHLLPIHFILLLKACYGHKHDFAFRLKQLSIP